MPTISIVLVGIGALFIVANWTTLIGSLVTKKPTSMIGPLSGVIAAVGLLFDPELRHLAWLGLVADVGFWSLALALPRLVIEYRRSAKSRLDTSLVGRFDGINVQLKLFKPNHYEIKLSRDAPPREIGWISRGSLGTWTRNADRVELVSHTDKPEQPSRAVLNFKATQNCYLVAESTFIIGDEYYPPEFPPIHVKLVP
jgi:hypothetical protein